MALTLNMLDVILKTKAATISQMHRGRSSPLTKVIYKVKNRLSGWRVGKCLPSPLIQRSLRLKLLFQGHNSLSHQKWWGTERQISLMETLCKKLKEKPAELESRAAVAGFTNLSQTTHSLLLPCCSHLPLGMTARCPPPPPSLAWLTAVTREGETEVISTAGRRGSIAGSGVV